MCPLPNSWQLGQLSDGTHQQFRCMVKAATDPPCTPQESVVAVSSANGPISRAARFLLRERSHRELALSRISGVALCE